MNSIEKIKIRKSRWTELLKSDGTINRIFLIDVENYIPVRPLLWKDKKQERLDWILKKYSIQLEMLEWLEDDKIPFLDMLTGTEIFAECFGCKISYPKDNTPFALSAISSSEDALKMKKPKLEDTPLMFLFDMADELKKRAGNDVVFRLPDIQSPMDIVALIWDKNDFYIALLEEPDAVKYLSGLVRDLMIEFLDEWFLRYGKEFIADFPDYYMPEGVCLSVDEIGVINEKMFNEYFMPEISYISNHYGSLGVHCCANAHHQWKNFKEVPHLKLLNLVQPNNILIEAYDYFSSHCAQMHCWNSDDPVWTWFDHMPHNSRTALQITVSNANEAKIAAEKLNKVCGR